MSKEERESERVPKWKHYISKATNKPNKLQYESGGNRQRVIKKMHRVNISAICEARSWLIAYHDSCDSQYFTRD